MFDLTFNTQAIDNTGLPHVFEHATLAGSDRYPSKALWFNLSYQSYNTFMNAMTAQTITTYPVASLSEAQLLKFADFYTDCCFHPMVMEDESIFREEAWRYRMGSAEEDLTLEGTVYSEMLGAMTLERMADYNSKRTALPGSYVGNVSGGDPAYIPDMTFEALKDYHNLYYHPSNCVAFLYGQFEDYAAFLAQLDEAFSGYERKDFTLEDPGYAPIDAPVEAEFSFPVEAGSDTNNASAIYYAFVCPGLKDDPHEEHVISTITGLFGSETSALSQTLKRALPSASFVCDIDYDGPDDLVLFSVNNVNREDAQTFREAVDAALAEVAEKGFPQDAVESEMSGLELSTRLAMESSEIGVDMVFNTAYYYADTGNPFYYIDILEAYSHMVEWNAEGVYAEAAAKWLAGSERTALTVTCPEAGLKEQQDDALAAKLAEVKAGMSEEEQNAIIEASNAQDGEDPLAAELVAQLQAVDVESLPEEYRVYDLRDETDENGVRYMDAVANVDGIGRVSLFFDAAGLPQEDIHWFHLFVALAGELDTSAHTAEELDVLINRYLYGVETRLSIAREGDGYQPRMRLGWTAMDEDQTEAYDLMHEIVYDTKFDDVQRILENIQSMKADLKYSINNAPYNVMLTRGMASTIPALRYSSYYNGLDFYDFLTQAEALFAENPEAGIERLEAVQQYFNNARNAIAAFAGSEESIARNRALAEAYMASLDNREIEPVAYDLPVPAHREALIVDAAIQYNIATANYGQLGLEGYTADMDALIALMDDTFLLPLLRDQYGAYGAFGGATEEDGVYVLSYRDPNVAETFAVYEQLSELLSAAQIEQDTLNGYILSSYTAYALPEGELTDAGEALNLLLEHRSQEETLENMRALKSATPEKMKGYADMYARLMEEGYRATAGGAAAINANADLYDVILNPFGAVDKSQTELSDVPQGSEHFEAVRYVYDNGFMAALEDGSFGLEAPATVGDLAGALYALAGGSSDPAEAVPALTEYGILWNGAEADEALTVEGCGSVLEAFAYAVGLEGSPEVDLGEDPLTRAALAETLYDYIGQLEADSAEEADAAA
ncbi:MAG: insulinase family protein [Clostridia bacterium]|nr:insulinase family protein [Clostridia bacterium]